MGTNRTTWADDLLAIRRSGARPEGGVFLTTDRVQAVLLAKRGLFVGVIREDEHYELMGLAGICVTIATRRFDLEWLQALCLDIVRVNPRWLLLGNLRRNQWQSIVAPASLRREVSREAA
jgi:hypothetical protein